MPTNYVLVDFENVQPDLSLLAGTAFKVKVFFGAKQQEGRVPYKLLKALLALGGNVETVEVKRSGKNALDMHIAYFVGRLLAQEPEAGIHIISGDTDFDPLVEYLAAGGVHCKRAKTISELTKQAPARTRSAAAPKAPRAARAPRAPKATVPTSAPPPPATAEPARGKLDSLVKHLRSMQDRPSTRKKLAKFIDTHLKQRGNSASASGIEELIGELIRTSRVRETASKLTWQLD